MECAARFSPRATLRPSCRRSRRGAAPRRACRDPRSRNWRSPDRQRRMGEAMARSCFWPKTAFCQSCRPVASSTPVMPRRQLETMILRRAARRLVDAGRGIVRVILRARQFPADLARGGIEGKERAVGSPGRSRGSRVHRGRSASSRSRARVSPARDRPPRLCGRRGETRPR